MGRSLKQNFQTYPDFLDIQFVTCFAKVFKAAALVLILENLFDPFTFIACVFYISMDLFFFDSFV